MVGKIVLNIRLLPTGCVFVFESRLVFVSLIILICCEVREWRLGLK